MKAVAFVDSLITVGRLVAKDRNNNLLNNLEIIMSNDVNVGEKIYLGKICDEEQFDDLSNLYFSFCKILNERCNNISLNITQFVLTLQSLYKRVIHNWQRLWHSWQINCFQHQRIWVHIQSTHHRFLVAEAVAMLSEQLLSTPGDLGSNPVINKMNIPSVSGGRATLGC